jgi:hypothetical protein
MVKSITEVFKPVHIALGTVHIAGGYVTKAIPVRSRTEADENGTDVAFVKLSTNEHWLQASTRIGFRGSTSLLQHLHDKIKNLCDGTESVHVPGEYDPMNEVGQDDADKKAISPMVRRTGGKRTRYYRNHGSKTVVTVDMPIRCPEEDAACTDMRTVTLYIKDRKSIWVALSDVDWAIKYLFVQNYLKGVPLISDDAPPSPDVPAGLIPMDPPSPDVPAGA